MKQRIADYIADFLVTHEIDHCFTVTGGGAMHLNDALGHKQGLTCVYNHHEQACAIAAEAHARLNNKIAAVCVTTGPGGTNALTGVVGGWIDSIPMLIISGQVRYDTTARSTGLPLRAMGDQEFDICKAVDSMTKYCEMVIDPSDIRFCLEKAFYLANTGRKGPCWLDIPLNVQGATVETDDLRAFDPAIIGSAAPSVEQATVDAIIERVRQAKRPVFNAGSAIRTSGGYEAFRHVVEKLGIPVVTGWNSIDLLEDGCPLYVGRAGMLGDRAGNFAIQNSDLILSIGSRLSIRQVGYNWEAWAREAYVIMNDVDEAELQKPTLHVDMPIWGDSKDLLDKLDDTLSMQIDPSAEQLAWKKQCAEWKVKYPVVLDRHKEADGLVNVYAFIDALNKQLDPGRIIVVGNGSACVICSHALKIEVGTRYIVNSGIASMGYDLPAAIGVCVAKYGREALCYNNEKDLTDIILLAGDGSIQMNFQELQTIIHHRMPIKIFLINNQGYHSIRQTQTNLFNGDYCGVGPQSGDLSFPDMEKLSLAYGFQYLSCHRNQDLPEFVAKALAIEGPAICEVFGSIDQVFEPKSATKRLEDGTLVSPPLEDLAPFLPRDEFRENMIIAPIS